MAEESRESLEAVRLEKLRRIEALGLDPWGQRFDGHQAIAEVRGLPLPEGTGTPGPAVRVAGRIMLRRGQGKVNFLELRDWTDRIQIFIGKNAGRRGRLGPGRRARPGRPARRRRHARPDQDRRADRLRHRADVPGQEPAAAPREVARPDRRRAARPAAVRRPVQQPRVAGDLPGPVEGHRRVPRTDGREGLRRGRDADDAADRRRRGGPAVRHPPQHARHRPVPADRPRALPEAAAGRRHGAGLRDRPRLPQRGDQPASTTPSSRCWRRTRPTATTTA